MIIRISGLPGAGKTLIADKLAQALEYRVFHIDEYRNKFQDELMALTELFRDMYITGDKFILDSVGFNHRFDWVFQFIKPRIVDIKLVCEENVLKERIRQKILPKDEFFPYGNSPREQYVKKFFIDMERKSCDIMIDTTSITPEVVMELALNDLKFYKQTPPANTREEKDKQRDQGGA